MLLPLPQLIVAMMQARRDAQDVAARVGQFEVDFASLKRWHEACIFDNTLSYEEYKEYYNRSSRELQEIRRASCRERVCQYV